MLGLPTPALTCVRRCVHLQDCFPDKIVFLTGASNNHNDSLPFVVSFTSRCALHHFRRARSGLPCYLPFCFPFPLPSFLRALSVHPVLGGQRAAGERVAVGRGKGKGRGSSHPVPSFPLRRKILAQGGSLLVSVYLVLVVLATCFC